MKKTNNGEHETVDTHQIENETESDDGTISEELLQEVLDFIRNLSDEEFERILDECGNNDDEIPDGFLFMSRADYERTKHMTPEEAVKALGW
ncbi:hypothetical protein MsAg5_02470 [Methanosarcinaceae archaeon Ag5]|uniref:Uncharacterized protein n=1 Tax=Methanolapillus africanus TaxID=3028297 RepID=A0AAE4MHS5_9EURY|nr:hypothetical protein [Methanosarcinaceae archaeon Ag5]